MYAAFSSPIHSQTPLSSPSVSALSWIPEKDSRASCAAIPSWYLGGKEIFPWCTHMSVGLSREKQIFLFKRVKWVVEATLANLQRLKEAVPQKTEEIRVVAISHEKQTHNLFLFQDSLFFSMPMTALGSSKTAIPMINLQTGDLLMRLCVKKTKCFDGFIKEQELQNSLAGPGILPILGSASYEVKNYDGRPLPKTDYVDEKYRSEDTHQRYRLCVFTPAYSYCLHDLSKMFAFTDFSKIHIALETAKALEQIHLKGYLHNDLKTINIFLDETQQVIIGDYGLSTPIDGPEKEDYIAMVRGDLKKTSSFLNAAQNNLTTPHIAAPELLKTYFTKESDIFAYGKVLLDICGKGSLFLDSVYNNDRCFHAKISERDYNARLEQVLGRRCLFDCLENIARDALSYRPGDRPSLISILERLNALYSYFPQFQKPCQLQFDGISPLAKLYLFHSNNWKKLFSPATPHFSSFKGSFFLWVDEVLRKHALREADQRKYFIKSCQFFEQLAPSGYNYVEIQERYRKITSTFFSIAISIDSEKFLGRLLVLRSRLLYRGPAILSNQHLTIRNIYDVKTGNLTHFRVITSKSPITIHPMKLRALLPHAISHHPSLMPIEGITSYLSKTGVEKIALLFSSNIYSYINTLTSNEILRSIDISKWALDLAHLLSLFHNEGLLLGKLQLSELGVDEKKQLVIRHLNSLVKEDSLTTLTPCSETSSTPPEHYLSLFNTPVSKENDVKNLAMILFTFVRQQQHPRPIKDEADCNSTISELLALKTQLELDLYLDINLSPRRSMDDMTMILRDMLSIDPHARPSSELAYRRLLSIEKKSGCAVM